MNKINIFQTINNLSSSSGGPTKTVLSLSKCLNNKVNLQLIYNEISQTNESYLQRFKNTPIDTLILGCTHYPLFKSIIEKHIHSKVLIVDSAKATSEHVLKYLHNKKLLTKNKLILEDRYYVSDKPIAFNHLAKDILNIDTNVVQQINI